MTNRWKILVTAVVVLSGAIVFYISSTKTVIAPIPENPQVITDNVRVETPRQNDEVASPLVIRGEARGPWYFEASFPVRLFDTNGKELAVKPAQAQGEWMTNEFVPFEVELTFEPPSTGTGILVLEKDNPSGLPEYADEVRIPIRFKKADKTSTSASGVRGTVTIGPTCPVLRDPPDPSCADKPYQTELKVTKKNSLFSKTISSGTDGIFYTELSPGEYAIAPAKTQTMPHMSPVEFAVREGEFTVLNLQFDSGIR